MSPYAKLLTRILQRTERRILRTAPKDRLAADIAVLFAISICMELLASLKEADLLLQPGENKQNQIGMENYLKAQKGQELIKTFLSN